jgi:hypothetical protein
MTLTPTGHVAHMKAVSSAYTIFIALRAARRIGCRMEVLKECLAKMWTEFSRVTTNLLRHLLIFSASVSV